MNKIKHTQDLRKLQTLFADVIMRPLIDNETNRKGVRSNSLKKDVENVISPNKHFNSVERIEMYNQQYWYRLVTVMQEEYPALRHLLKIEKFNKLIIQYLDHFPSTFYSLNHLSDRFIEFLNKFYFENNKKKIIELAEFEYAYIRAFDTKNQSVLIPSKLSPEQISNLSSIKIELQKSATLFEHSYDFSSYRDDVFDDDDDEIFPTLVRKRNFICVYRRHNTVLDEAISESEYHILSKFIKANSIENALDGIQEKLIEKDFSNIQSYFQKWIDLGFFVLVG